MVGNEEKIDGKEEKSWINLFSKYYGGYQIPNPGIDGSNADTIVILPNFTFLRTGYYNWNKGKLDEKNFYGLYWSLYSYSSNNSRSLNLHFEFIGYDIGGGNKGIGFSLR